MKRLILYLNLLIAIVAIGLVPATMTGCANLEKTAFKATGVTESVGDKAIRAWDDYIVQQKAKGTPVALSDEVRVKQAYEAYLRAGLAVTDAGLAYSRVKNSPNQAGLPAAQQAVNQASAALGASIAGLLDLLSSLGLKVQ